jgi:hypothetical protein
MKVDFENKYENSFFTNYSNFDEETIKFVELAKKYPNSRVKFKQYQEYVFIYETLIEKTKWYVSFGGNAEAIQNLGLYNIERLEQIMRPNLIRAMIARL